MSRDEDTEVRDTEDLVILGTEATKVGRIPVLGVFLWWPWCERSLVTGQCHLSEGETPRSPAPMERTVLVSVTLEIAVMHQLCVTVSETTSPTVMREAGDTCERLAQKSLIFWGTLVFTVCRPLSKHCLSPLLKTAQHESFCHQFDLTQLLGNPGVLFVRRIK